MAVFVLDRRKKPLMPCSEKRARIMLERGRARIHRMMPFTIRLVDRLQENSVLQPLRLKLDPGSKTTGLALAREAEHVWVMDMAPPGKKVRTNHGRVAIRASGGVNIQPEIGIIQDTSHRLCFMIQREDGHSTTKIAATKGEAGRWAAHAAGLSLTGKNACGYRAIE